MMKANIASVILILLAYGGCTVRAIQDTSSIQDTEQTPASIKETVESLRQIMTDRFEYRIPLTAKPLLAALKHQLRDVIDTRINSESTQTTAADLQASILEDLKNLGVLTLESPDDHIADEDYFETEFTYGEICSITVENPDGRRDLLAATTSIGVTCGIDTSLYIFKKNGPRWELVLEDEANNYEEVSSARWELQYAISSRDKENNFFVVAADITPWCTSSWRRLRFRVLRPGPTADGPRVLLSEERTIFLGMDLEDDRSYRLKLRGNRFTLKFLGEKFEKWVTDPQTDFDPQHPGSLDVVSYRVIGDGVTAV